MTKWYRKKKIQPMYPWQEGMEMAEVSIAEEDRKNGSPQYALSKVGGHLGREEKWVIEVADKYKEALNE